MESIHASQRKKNLSNSEVWCAGSEISQVPREAPYSPTLFRHEPPKRRENWKNPIAKRAGRVLPLGYKTSQFREEGRGRGGGQRGD